MSWAGGFVSFCIVCIAGAPTAKPAASHADRAWREWAGYPLHGAGLPPNRSAILRTPGRPGVARAFLMHSSSSGAIGGRPSLFRGDLDHVAVRLLSLDLGGRQIRKALAQQHFDRADLRQRYSRRMVPSVEVRPRRSIAPVLKKVSVDLLTIAQPLGLRRREEWLLPTEWLTDRHPLFRNGHSRQNSNHRSDFDRGRPMIRHDRSIHAMRSQARTLGLWRHCECEVRHSEDGGRLSQPRWGNPNEVRHGTSRTCPAVIARHLSEQRCRCAVPRRREDSTRRRAACLRPN
jgi:hypothetical protein